MKDPRYQSYIRNNWPLPFVAPWAWGPTHIAQPPFQWQFILITHLGDKSGWHYHEDEVITLGHTIDHYLAQPKYLKKFVRAAKKVKQDNLLFARRIAGLQPNRLRLQALTTALRQWHLAHSRFAAAYMAIDATDETLEFDIRNALQQSGCTLAIDDIAALLTPNASTYVQKEHEEFCALAKRHRKSLNTEAAQQAITRHARRWWWTAMGWGQYRPLDEKAIIKNLQQIRNISVLLNQQRHDEQLRAATLRHKRKLVRQLPNTVSHLLDAFEVLADMHDTRKEVQMKMMWACFSLTEAILKKMHIPLSYRDYILIDEYLKFGAGQKPAIKELHNRKHAYWCATTSRGKTLLLSGATAVARLKRSKIYEREDGTRVTTIRGVPASPGIVRGRVRVGLDPRALLRTLQPGEILVTSQTTPEFAPIMKKAAAIVTNEGGITSHAAIVSRELKKPCVIGTKIATDVLKTGDLVEVDANKGIVRKIS